MREILVNALIYRDYTIAGGAVSPAIFDDRVEAWSSGRFPTGITPESLKHALDGETVAIATLEHMRVRPVAHREITLVRRVA